MTDDKATPAAPRRGVLAARLAAAAGLAVVATAAVLVAGPWPGGAAAVAPADAGGVDVLDPPAVAADAASKAAGGEPVERAVGRWVPTDGPPNPSGKKR